MSSSLKVRKMVTIGMLSTVGYVLMLLNFPFPGLPPFLMVDFSDIPALIAALVFGPVSGIMVELLKNILDYAMTGSETGVPVGHVANFVGGIAFILPANYIYQKYKTKKSMAIGLVAATFCLAILMSILNYFVFLPAYTMFLGFTAMSSPEARMYIVSAILPFNFIKGTLITIAFLLLFSKMHVWITKQASFQRIKNA